MELDQEQANLFERARKLAVLELAPRAAQVDRDAAFPFHSLQAFASEGLTGMTVPKAYGGRGMGVLEACLALEGVAYGCMASAMALQLNVNGPSRVIARVGTEEQKRRYLPKVVAGDHVFAVAMTEPQAGSDGLALQTMLTPDGRGFRLTGTKCYITAADVADSLVVFCRAPETRGMSGIGAVIVERGDPGFEIVETQPKMGSRGVNEATLRFDDVFIGPERVLVMPDPGSRAGGEFLLVQFNPERCGNAAMCLGVAQSAFDFSLDYAKKREQFGRPVAEFQGQQWRFSDMAVALEAARLMLWRAARTDENGFPALRETAMAKLLCNETAIEVCNEAIGAMGHRGFLLESPVERNFRDVRGMAIAGGTVDVLRNIVGGYVTGMKVNQRSSR